MDVTAEALRRRRAAAQGLVDGAPSVASLLAVQAQDARSTALALRARGLTIGEGLVVGWLLRGTLHLVRIEDYWWLHGLTAPRGRAGGARRLAQEGVTEDEARRAVELVGRALHAEGPLGRAALGERLARAGIRTEGQALPHLLARAAREGVAVRLPGGERPFAASREVVGRRVEADRAVALAELARRYLVAHGPATAADLARWSGLALRDARAGLRAIAVEQTGDGLLDLPGRAPADAPAPPRLLPAFDPYLLGWRDRSFAVPAEHARTVHPGGGMPRAVATEDGRAVGTWTQAGGRVEIAWFEGRERRGVEAEIAAVEELA